MPLKNRFKILLAEKEMKEGRRLTYRTIAAETGLSTNTLTKYANQKVSSFDADTVAALCQYFGCSPGELIVLE